MSEENNDLMIKINKILDEIEEKIRLEDLKIRAYALETHFSSNYIIELRDDFNRNKGKREMFDLIRNKIIKIQEGDVK